MRSYLPDVDSESPVVADPLVETVGSPAGMVAFRSAELLDCPWAPGAVLVVPAGAAMAAVPPGL